MKANTSVHLTEQLVQNRDFIAGTLAELMDSKFTIDRTRPVIFSPFGLGVLDLAVGKWIYDRARQSGSGLTLDDFFFETTR
jgi:ornithine cyclodeaminase